MSVRLPFYTLIVLNKRESVGLEPLIGFPEFESKYSIKKYY